MNKYGEEQLERRVKNLSKDEYLKERKEIHEERKAIWLRKIKGELDLV